MRCGGGSIGSVRREPLGLDRMNHIFLAGVLTGAGQVIAVE